MSQAPSSLGSVRIDFIGNDESLRRTAQNAKVITEKAAAEAEQASQVTIGREARQTISRGLGGLASVGSLIGAGDTLLRGIGEFQAAAGQLVSQLKETTNGLSFQLSGQGGSQIDSQLARIIETAQARLVQVGEQARADQNDLKTIIADLVYRLGPLAGSAAGFAKDLATDRGPTFADTQAQAIRDSVAGAERTAQLLREADADQKEADRLRSERIRNAEALTALQEESIRLSREGRSEEEKLNDEFDARIDKLERLRETRPNDSGWDQAIDATEQRLIDFTTRRVRMIRKAAEDEARAVEEAFGKTIDRIRSQSASLFPADRLEATVDNLTQKVDLIVQQLSRIPS